jgi:hypothetical protein
MNNFSVLQNHFQAFFKIVYNGNAVPKRSCNILTMGTAFPRVPLRNDHWSEYLHVMSVHPYEIANSIA